MTIEADKAVQYMLGRIQTDADLNYILCDTTAHALLCAAEAATTGEALDAVKERRRELHARYPRRYFSDMDIRHMLGRALRAGGHELGMGTEEAIAERLVALLAKGDEDEETDDEGAEATA